MLRADALAGLSSLAGALGFAEPGNPDAARRSPPARQSSPGVFVAEQAQEPARTSPRALIGATLLLRARYRFINASSFFALSPRGSTDATRAPHATAACS